MKIKYIIFLIFVCSLLFATNMIIEKTDGTRQVINLEEIENISFEVSPTNAPSRVLFIGNSYTYGNNGIDTHLENFVAAANPDHSFHSQRIAFGSYTLAMHQTSATTISTINSGNWDYVVLQEQSQMPVYDPEAMYAAAIALDDVITTARSKTAFFMTWARAYDPTMIEGLASAYTAIGDSLNAMVCPVGLAWQKSLQQNPELALHTSDESHPNVYGTYLAVCVFYACFFNQSPEGVDYVVDDIINIEQRNFLQRIAWETVLEYRNEN